jgi:hypothetical protein
VAGGWPESFPACALGRDLGAVIKLGVVPLSVPRQQATIDMYKFMRHIR